MPAENPAPPPVAPRSTPAAALGVVVAAVIVAVGGLVGGAWALWGRRHDSATQSFAATTTTSPVPSTSAPPTTTGPHPAVTPLHLTPAWRFHSAELFGGIAGDANHVYAVTNSAHNAALVALDAKTGRQLWRAPLGQSAFERPVASNGLVATVAMDQNRNGIIQVRDGNTGRLLWQRNPVAQDRPFLAAGNLVVESMGSGGSGTTIVGLDLRTGQQRWSLQRDFGDLYTADTDAQRLFLSNFSGLSAIDGATGRVLWRRPDTKGSIKVTAGGRLVLAGVDELPPQSSTGQWRAIDPLSGATRWTRSIAKPDPDKDVVLVGGQVVTPSGGLHAYASATGAPSWSHPQTDEVGGSPPLAAASNHLLTIAGATAGSAIQELDPSTGEVTRATLVPYPEDIFAFDHLVVVVVLDGLEAFRY